MKQMHSACMTQEEARICRTRLYSSKGCESVTNNRRVWGSIGAQYETKIRETGGSKTAEHEIVQKITKQD